MICHGSERIYTLRMKKKGFFGLVFISSYIYIFVKQWTKLVLQSLYLFIKLHIHVLYPYYKMLQINSGYRRIFIVSISFLARLGICYICLWANLLYVLCTEGFCFNFNLVKLCCPISLVYPMNYILKK